MNIHTISDQTERMADLVRRQHPSLDTMLLEPDGKYQTRAVALDTLMHEARDCIAAGFRDRAAEDFPMLYCAWGKCRVGSTALTNLFGVAGVPAHFQPVKVILRHALVGSASAPWMIPHTGDQPHIFAKEMAGPYVLAESLFQPLQPLIEAGYPADRLHFIMLDRDPASSLVSWLEKWSDRIPESRLIHNYVIATLNSCVSKATPSDMVFRSPTTSMKQARRRPSRSGPCSTALALRPASPRARSRTGRKGDDWSRRIQASPS